MADRTRLELATSSATAGSNDESKKIGKRKSGKILRPFNKL
jgi:hypothetical protein